MADPLVSVVISARDASDTIDRTLTALRAQEFDGPFEVIVVDNGSLDETKEIIRRYAPFVRLLERERGDGPGSARNLGAHEARGPVLAFTDSDCFPTRTWLARGLAATRDAELVQGHVEPDPSTPRTPFDRTLRVDRDRSFYQTANLFVRRETFTAASGFEDWPPPGHRRETRLWGGKRPFGEDTLFAWKAIRGGARSRFAEDALVYHAVTPGRLRDVFADRWAWTTKMAGLARYVPELRDEAFYLRWFFADWSFAFDLAVAAIIVSVSLRRRALLLLSLPYARRVARESSIYRHSGGSRGRRFTLALRHAVGAPAVDAVTLLGLAIGSLEWRCLVL